MGGSAPGSWHRQVNPVGWREHGVLEKREEGPAPCGALNPGAVGRLAPSIRCPGPWLSGWESPPLLPALAFPLLFLSPSFWAGSPEKFTTSHCLQTPGVTQSCHPRAGLMTSHPHTPPATPCRELAAWLHCWQRRPGRRVWLVGQEL